MILPKRTELKKRAFQHNRCFYCGIGLDECDVEIDHIIPFSVSKDGTVANLCLCCQHCNRLKHDHSLAAFHEIVSERFPEKLIRGQFYFQFLNLYNG